MFLAPDCPVKKIRSGRRQGLAIIKVLEIFNQDSGARSVQDDMVEGQKQNSAPRPGHQQAEAEEGTGFQVIGPVQLIDPVFDLFRSAFQAKELYRDLIMNYMAILALIYRIRRAQDAVTSHQPLKCILPTICIDFSLEQKSVFNIVGERTGMESIFRHHLAFGIGQGPIRAVCCRQEFLFLR